MKLSQRGKITIFTAYILLTLLGVFLWVMIPDFVHFIGASSIVYAFLFAVGVDHSFVAYLALAWIPIFVVALITCYVIAGCKKKNTYFSILVGVELAISLIFLLWKIAVGNYTDLDIAFTGYVVRIIQYVGLLYCVQSPSSEV